MASRRDRLGRSNADAAGTAAREARLIRAARRGDSRARELLVGSHLGMVRAVASRYRNAGLPFEDLVQEGSLGLLEAIERYDSRRGDSFAAYACFRVRRANVNALTQQARLIRLPKQVVERRRTVARAEDRLAAATGRTPTPVELAAVTGLSEAAVLEARTAPTSPLSLDARPARDLPPLESVIADASARDPEREALVTETARLVREAVDKLPPRQRYIVRKRFGLGGDELDVAALADQLQLSKRRTRTLEHDALSHLAADLEPALER